ncbi:MAG: Saccharopine dehydrogenase [Parcubacteria group bacterium GW2011_GWA1_48_11b]|nr:MAG: Saccharopine dehydrogenase [Parcubacteria group bacterium GW2011_GWA1_48_11b]
MKSKCRFVVLGGAGTIGRVVVRDLFESSSGNHILIADYNEKAARRLASSLGGGRVRAVFADAHQDLSLLLKNQTVVINCLQYNFNLPAMKAALSAGVHYLDLGGLFSVTRQQLKLNKAFKDAGLTAIIGMGCAPGITNILAGYAASLLHKVESIKIRVGSIDFGPPSRKLRLPYSAQTIVEELTLKPWVFRDGKFCEISPRTGWERTQFPKPVGKAWTLWTRHSEIATLPLSFRKKGLKYCDFKVGFDHKFVREVMKRLRSGWDMNRFNKLMTPVLQPNDYEVSQVTVGDLVVECFASPRPEWHAGAGDIDTACPASIVAQMIADGQVDQRGVLPPEIAVPVLSFFRELEKRGLHVTIRH